jgi:cysteine-rich repeat protein
MNKKTLTRETLFTVLYQKRCASFLHNYVYMMLCIRTNVKSITLAMHCHILRFACLMNLFVYGIYATRTTITFHDPLAQDPVINIPVACSMCSVKLVERFENRVTVDYEHPLTYVTNWQSFFPNNTVSDVAELCGNQILDISEQCDDGNRIDSDECSNDCMLNPNMRTPEAAKITADETVAKITADETVAKITADETIVKITADETGAGDEHEVPSEESTADETVAKITADETVAPNPNRDTTTEIIYDNKTGISIVAKISDAPSIPGNLLPLPHVNVNNRRRLLQIDQITINVRIFSDDISTAETIAANINLENLAGFCNATLGSTCVTAQSPTSTIESADTILGTVTTELPGFQVLSVTYQFSSLSWIVKAKYKPNIPNTITSLYLPKINSPIDQYTTIEKNSYFASMHPCVEGGSICCALNYRDHYNVGIFANNITNNLGTCGSSVQANNTLGLFNPSENSDWIDHFFASIPGCRIQRIADNEIDIYLSASDIRDRFSMRSDIAGGYTLDFFVGMTYATLLPTNAISTSISQTRIVLTITNNLMFSIASQQDYTFVKYVTIALQQNKYIDGPYSRKMQSAKVGIVVPKTMRQNMNTGFVPLSSIRFAISKSTPAITDTNKWINPCFSTSGTSAMFDVISGWRELYVNSAAQSCALPQPLCTNPLVETLSNGIHLSPTVINVSPF